MFKNKNLSVIAYANGFTLWHYHGEERLEEIIKDGFFNSIIDLCATGDIIIINGTDTTAIKTIKLDNKQVTLTNL